MKDTDLFSKPPSVVINGDRELVMEGKLRITDYKKDRITLDVKYKGRCAVICGKDLKLCVISENVFSVNGTIESFSYVKKGEV